MSNVPHDISPLIDLTRRQMVGPVRTSHPRYVNLLPPCNDACPAGENIQGWLAQAQAGRLQKAWEVLIRDNPFSAIGQMRWARATKKESYIRANYTAHGKELRFW